MNDATQSQYLQLAEATLRQVELAADAVDLDSKREGSVLTLELDDRSQIIINLQQPIQELWLASRCGAYHFRHDGQAWRDSREGLGFFELLRQALQQLGGPALALPQD